MTRRLISTMIPDEAGNRLGGPSTEVRVYDDFALTTLSSIYPTDTGGSPLPNPVIPNSGWYSDLDLAALNTDTTVRVRDLGTFRVGDRLRIRDATNTVFKSIISINTGTRVITLDSALGVGFAIGSMAGGADMVGHMWFYVDDAADKFAQAKDVASGRLSPPLQFPVRVPAAALAVQEEGSTIGTRSILNFIGRIATAADDAGNGRVNVTLGIAGSEAAPAPEVIGDTDTGLWGEGANIVSVVGGGKRIAQFVGGTTLVNFAMLQANVTGGAAVFGAGGADANVGVDIYTKGTGGFRVVHGGARVGLNVPSVASSVNYAEAVPAATGGAVVIQAAGGDANTELHLKGKGTFGVVIANNFTDFLWVVGGAGSTTLSGVGGSANVAVVVQGKGTGSVQLVVSAAGGAVVIGRTAQDYFTSTAATGTVDWTAAGASAAININLVPKGAGLLQYNGTEVSKVGHAHTLGGSTYSAEDATTSGTSRDITGIPAGVRRITIMLFGVSKAAGSDAAMVLQIGDSGGVETSGYENAYGQGVPGGSPAFQGAGSYTTGFRLQSSIVTDTDTHSGIWELINENGNGWLLAGQMISSTGSNTYFTTGRKTLSGTLDRVRLTSDTGAATFDAGVWRLLYE